MSSASRHLHELADAEDAKLGGHLNSIAMYQQRIEELREVVATCQERAAAYRTAALLLTEPPDAAPARSPKRSDAR